MMNFAVADLAGGFLVKAISLSLIIIRLFKLSRAVMVTAGLGFST